jgi:hypothetical protein
MKPIIEEVRNNIYTEIKKVLYDKNPLQYKAYQELWRTLNEEVNDRRVQIKGNIKREYGTSTQ